MYKLDQKFDQSIARILDSRSMMEFWDRAADKLDLDAAGFKVIFDINTQVFLKKVGLAEVVPFLKKNLKDKKEKEIRNIAFVLACYCYSPVAEFLGEDVGKWAESLGGSRAEFDKISKKVIDEIQKEINPVLPELEYNPDAFLEDKTVSLSEEEISRALSVDDIPAEQENLKKTFQNYFLDALFSDEALGYLINYRLIYTLGNSDLAFKNTLLRTVSSCQDKITEQGLKLEGREVEGTVANWLKDFLKYVGLRDRISAVKRAQYLAASDNVKLLNAEDKRRLNTLLEFYRMLQGFPDSLEGIPPERWYMIPIKSMEAEKLAELKEKAARVKRGERFEVKKKEKEMERDMRLEKKEEKTAAPRMIAKPLKKKKLAPPKPAVVRESKAPISIREKAEKEREDQRRRIVRLYEGNREENKAIEEAAKRILKITGKRSKALLDYLIKEYNAPEPDYVNLIAALKVVSSAGYIEDFLNDPRSARLVEDCMGPEESALFRENPLTKKALEKLLQCVLESKLGVETREAARIGLQISNILRRRGQTRYADMARFNIRKDQFEWV